MLQNYSRYRILQEFFDFPRKQFQMRELSRRVCLAQPAVVAHLKALVKEELVIREKTGLYPAFRANRDNETFKLLKKHNIIWRITTSGLVEHLRQKTQPNCLVLFGSAARGEDTEQSDVDLFVQAEDSSLDLSRYEKMLHRKINLLFEPKLANLSKELLNNLINGAVLYGYFKVF